MDFKKHLYIIYILYIIYKTLLLLREINYEIVLKY